MAKKPNYDSVRMIARTIPLPSLIFRQLMDRVGVEFQNAFDDAYDYDRPEGPAIVRVNGRPRVVKGITGTLRQNGDLLSDEYGSLPYSPRDILDTEALADSQQRFDGPGATLFRWTGDGKKDYALFVHDGYVPILFGNTGYRVPGRPWTLKTLLRMRGLIADVARQVIPGEG